MLKNIECLKKRLKIIWYLEVQLTIKAMRQKVKNQSKQCISPRYEVTSSKKLTKFHL